MDYQNFLTEFNLIQKKALFILNHNGYDSRLDTSVREKDIIGLDFDSKSVTVQYDNAGNNSYQEISCHEIPIELITMSYAELESKFSANVKKYEEFQRLKKKFE